MYDMYPPSPKSWFFWFDLLGGRGDASFQAVDAAQLRRDIGKGFN